MTRMTPALARLLVDDHRDKPVHEEQRGPDPDAPTAAVPIPQQPRGGRYLRTGARSGVRSPRR